VQFLVNQSFVHVEESDKIYFKEARIQIKKVRFDDSRILFEVFVCRKASRIGNLLKLLDWMLRLLKWLGWSKMRLTFLKL
jgi:hypothetical protein